MAAGSAATGISGAVIRGGRGAVSFVSGRGSSTGSAGGNGGPAGDTGSPPAWARAMQRRQTMSQGLGALGRALRDGDRGGAATTVNLRGDNR